MDKRLASEPENIRARHIQRQNQRRRVMKRRRTVFYCVVSLILIFILLFFTPLFDIKKIDIIGNEKIETAIIKQAIGSVEEENLFRLNTKKIENSIKEMPYINSVEIKKAIFPVSLKVNIVECQPIGFVLFGEKYAVLDKNLKVLEISDVKPETFTEIIGIEVSSTNPGAVIGVEDVEKLTNVIESVSVIDSEGIISGVTYIDFTDMNAVVFNYENRLNVICGSTVNFAKKISMFNMALDSDKLTANSRGTIDLSITGKAIYTP